MSFVRFAVLLRHKSSQFFEFFTLKRFVEWLQLIQQWTSWKVKLYTCLYFGLYIGYNVKLFVRFFYTFHCMLNNRLEMLRRVDDYFYHMCLIIARNHILLVVAIFITLIFTCSVTFYIFFLVPRYFKLLFIDIQHIFKVLVDNYLDTLSLIKYGSKEKIKQRIFQVCCQFDSESNPFMTMQDRFRIVVIVKVLGIFYIPSVITLVLSLLIGSIWIGYLILGSAQLHWLSSRAFYIYRDVSLTVFQQTLHGMGLCFFLALALYIYIEIASITWNHETGRLIRSSRLLDQSLRSKFKRQRILFVHTLASFEYLNHFGTGRFFSVTIALNLVANIILVMEMLIGDLNKTTKIWSFALALSQMGNTFQAVVVLIRHSESLYRISKHYQSALVRKHRAFDFQKCLSLALFLETLRPKRKFHFQLGPLSKLNRKALLDFWFFYTTCLMFILPFIVRQNK